MSEGRGPINVSIDGFHVQVLHGLPVLLDNYCDEASVTHLGDLSADEGDVFFVGAGRRRSWPELVIAHRYQPCGYGFDPGVAVVPETGVLFIGAGEQLQAWRFGDRIEQLWEDHADFGFWRWDVVDNTVLMSAELELAAWDDNGTKLWATFVEPPWHYDIDGETVALDVMGHQARFPVRSGPAWEKLPWR